jgi:hypothetical protein
VPRRIRGSENDFSHKLVRAKTEAKTKPKPKGSAASKWLQYSRPASVCPLSGGGHPGGAVAKLDCNCRLGLAASFMTMGEHIAAQRVLNARDGINEWCLNQKKTHYEGLKRGNRHGLSTSLCFLGMLDGLRRISNHLGPAAYGFSPTAARKQKAKIKSGTEKPTQPNLISPPQNPIINS